MLFRERWRILPPSVETGRNHAVSPIPGGRTLRPSHWSARLRHRYPDLPITVTIWRRRPVGARPVRLLATMFSTFISALAICPMRFNRFPHKIDPAAAADSRDWRSGHLIAALQCKRHIFRWLPLMRAFPPAPPRVTRSLASLSGTPCAVSPWISCRAQNEEDGERFVALGAKNNQVTVNKQSGNLIFQLRRSWRLCRYAAPLRRRTGPNGLPPAPTMAKRVSLSPPPCVITSIPEFITDSEPRQPERFPDAINLVRQAGVATSPLFAEVRRPPAIPCRGGRRCTMGELMLLYGIADLAFVGGSLVERGGHNPLEAAVMRFRY